MLALLYKILLNLHMMCLSDGAIAYSTYQKCKLAIHCMRKISIEQPWVYSKLLIEQSNTFLISPRATNETI